MANFNFDTSSYPKPQPPQNPLDSIIKVGQVADTLGGIEAGKAVQGALNDDGTIDQNRLASALRGTVAGSMKAIPTLDALQKLRQAGFAADQSGLETFQKRMALTNHLFSGLASKENPTIQDVLDVAGKAMDPGLDAKKYGITAPVIMGTLKQFYGPNGKPLTSQQIRQKALEIQTQAATTSEILGQHSPGVRVVQTPQGVQFQPAGTASNPAYTETPYGIAPNEKVVDTNQFLPNGKPNPNFNREVMVGQQPMPKPQPLNAPPVRQALEGMTGYKVEGPETSPDTGKPIRGFEDRWSDTGQLRPRGFAVGQQPGYTQEAQAGANAANTLMTAANEIPMTKSILDNLEHDLTKFTSGQGADWTRVAKNFANRNIPMPDSWKKEGAIFDAKSLASQENFNKLAQQLAQAQFQQLGGTGTDAKLNSAMSTSPNEYLSALGNRGIIRLLKGNQDAIAAKYKEWLDWRKAGNPPSSYGEFSAWFNDHFDPKVFQFKYLSPKDRQEYLNGMDPDAQQKFLRDLTFARKKDWVKFQVK